MAVANDGHPWGHRACSVLSMTSAVRNQEPGCGDQQTRQNEDVWLCSRRIIRDQWPAWIAARYRAFQAARLSGTVVLAAGVALGQADLFLRSIGPPENPCPKGLRRAKINVRSLAYLNYRSAEGGQARHAVARGESGEALPRCPARDAC